MARKARVIDAEVVEEATPVEPTELAFDELATFNALVRELGINPDAEVDLGLDIRTMVEKITGATYTTYTRENKAQLEELLALNDDDAAREWFRQQQLLSLPDQIALPAGPAPDEVVE